ncbi:MAG: amino acid adenylation domain-containing protein [Candidatus Anammoxibacter sp.]
MTVQEKKILHTVFDATAEKFPGNIAVVNGNRDISYEALKKASDRIACQLRSVGVQKDVIVGIVMQSSIEYVATIIGVLKANGVFLPLDVNFPDNRLGYILNNSAPSVIITGNENYKSVFRRFEGLNTTTEKECSMLVLDDDLYLRNDMETVEFKSNLVPADLCLPCPDDSNYIMYTSGSTGNPKAIVGRHKSLSHFMHWEVQEFGLDEQVKVSQLTPVTFDASLRDIFVPLITGGRVCIPEKDVKSNVKYLIEWLEDNGVTLAHCVPSLFRLITKEFESINDKNGILPDLKYILMAGESVYGRDVCRWMDLVGERIQLVNLYGASETTLIKTFHRIEERPENQNSIVPIGKPISNTAILIIKGGRLCEIGEAGEIFIKTPFMTKGYYNDPEMTKRCFVCNPLNTNEDDIVYKTGDLGRYAADRSVEFIGRLDTQVKVNGIRIELGEIEKILMNCKSIDQAVMLAHKNLENENTLSCYYTEKTATCTEEIRTHLLRYLPDYMIPSFYVRLDEFPLNINGKIDKKNLPKPDELMYEDIKYEPPANELEEKLARIWGEVLDLKKIGVNSPFYEIGGHSLKATRIISKIFRELDREIGLKDFFEYFTIRKLSNFLATAKKTTFSEIPLLKKQEYYDLSNAQRRLWILDQMEGASIAYNMFGAYLFEGSLDVSLFLKVFKSLVKRHESLRTVFIAVDGVPKQTICEFSDELKTFDFKAFDLSRDIDQKQRGNQDLSKSAIERMIKKYVKKDSIIPFDLSKGPLIRIQLLKFSDDCHAVLFNMHHIIGDAWSLEVLSSELTTLYDQYQSGGVAQGLYSGVQYKDYAAWQNALLKSDEINVLADYWHTKLSGEIPVLNLPLDYPRPQVQSYKGNDANFILGKEQTDALSVLCKKHDTSLFMTLLSAVKTLLHLYTGQEDIIVGSPVAGRNNPDLENQVGLYVNTLALRDAITEHDSFSTILKRVKQTTIEAYDHQSYPFDHLVDELNLAKDVSRAPLFDVMIVLQNNDLSEMHTAKFTITELDVELETSKFDLTFIFKETENQIQVCLNYNTDLFKAETIKRLGRHFENVIKGVLENEDQQIGDLRILSERDEEELLIDFNNNKHTFPEDKSLVDLFEEQAKKTPDNVAVIFYDRTVSYRNLNIWKDKLAQYLIDVCAVKPGDFVGLMIGRSDWSVLCLLSILKAGAVYLPLDPAYPQKRIDYMLNNSRCKVLITENEYKDVDLRDSPMIVGLEKIKKLVRENASRCSSFTDADKNQTACVLYTSGSTGTPKGIVLGHSGYVNMSLALIRYFNLTEHDRVLQFASYSFDVSMSEIFMTLLSGGALVVADKEKIDDPNEFLTYLEKRNVTVALLSPGYLNALNRDRMNTLRILITGGEPPILEDVYYYSEKMQYYNAYGPTEASANTTIHKVRPGKKYTHSVPIGKPISNLSIYILNNSLKLVPIGVTGEICIAGVGLAGKYLDQPELTKEKFIPNPFKSGEKLYKTGDLGRWLPDGEIEFFGRRDEQVKVRGYRIELGEIENTVLRHPSVSEAVVIKLQESGDLAAYIVCLNEVNVSDLKSHCRTYLPEYMIPSVFVPLQSMPLTVAGTGKIDKKALPAPDIALSSTRLNDYAAPRNDLEERLVEIWKKIIGKSQIGIYDNFFELGGTSLNSVQLASKISTIFKMNFSARTLFLNQTIEKLATEIGKVAPEASPGKMLTAHPHHRLSKMASIERNPLDELIASGRIAAVDSVALEYFPDNLIEQLNGDRSEIINRWCQKLPVVFAVTETFLGRIASIILPFFASELFNDRSGLTSSILQALDMADKIGSRVVSLTGYLSSATNYGQNIVSAMIAETNLPKITTGHGTITATLIMNVERILKESHRRLEDEKVGIVGLGSIGTAALRLMLKCLPHPKEIMLFDVYQNSALLENVKQQVKRDFNFCGVVCALQATQEIPDEFYNSTLIVGATNVPDILSIEKIKPGTLIVNDSGRTCFNLDTAIQRCERQKDILFTEGDVLNSPIPATRSIYLPPFVEDELNETHLKSLVEFHPDLITGCVLSSLLSARFDEIKSITGTVASDSCLQNFQLLKQTGFKAAQLHYENYTPSEEIITHFKNQYSDKY